MPAAVLATGNLSRLFRLSRTVAGAAVSQVDWVQASLKDTRQ